MKTNRPNPIASTFNLAKAVKSRTSKSGSRLVLVDVHCDKPADAEKVRNALKQGYKNNGSLVLV